MPMIVTADITRLLDALTAGDEAGVIQTTVELLGQNVPPAKIAARVGIPAAWGSGDGHPLSVLSVAGQVAEWMRAIPIGPEPGAERRQQLSPALPLVQGFMAVADRVRKGLPEPHPELPEPLLPADLVNEGGNLAAFRAALAARDLNRARAILMGYYATGTDYRSLQTLLYAGVDLRYPEGGHPLIFAVSGGQVLDMADWGDRVPAYIYWVTPLLLDPAPDAAAGQAARAYAQAEGHDLGWLRTRLAIPKEEVAGAAFQRALVAGDATAACDVVLKALRDGATPMGVAAGTALAAAELVNAVPQGDRDGIARAGHVLQYAHSVHVATRQTQNEEIWPLLYTAGCAVNAASTAGRAASPAAIPAPPSVPLGGLMPASMLRTLEQAMAAGDTPTGLASARRYLQMGHSPRALAGVIGAVASSRDVLLDQPEAVHALPLAAAAAEEYLTLPPALAQAGQNALLSAAIRLASELSGGHARSDRIRAAIQAQR
jgi:hypothetical protein